MSSSRFSYSSQPSPSSGSGSGPPPRFSMPGPSHAQQPTPYSPSASQHSPYSASPASTAGNRSSLAGATYPLSPPPQSALPSSSTSSSAGVGYSPRARFSTSSLASSTGTGAGTGTSTAPTSFLARTPSLSSSGSAGGSGGGGGAQGVGGAVGGAAGAAYGIGMAQEQRQGGTSGYNAHAHAHAHAHATQQDPLDRPRDKTKNTQVSSSALAFLYAEMVSYTQGRVSGIGELERKLSLMGYHHGQRLLPLLHARIESPAGGGSASSAKNPKRETRLLPVLLWVHGQAWKAMFGKAADSLERSTERSDEYMISTNTPLYSRSIAIPRDMSQLSVEAYTAGIVEALLDGMGFPARVTAHSVPTEVHPQRTTILIKLDRSVMEREKALGG